AAVCSSATSPSPARARAATCPLSLHDALPICEHGRENTQIRAVRRDVEDSGCPKQGRSVDTGRVFLHDLPMPCRTHRHWWEKHCPEIRMQASCWARTIVALASSDQSASGLVLPAHPQAG